MDLQTLLKSCVIFLVVFNSRIDSAKPRRAGRGKKQPRSLLVSGKCKPHILAEYELTFHAEWSQTTFPKMFPRYRPAAQWSQLVGRAHSPGYTMWSTDTLASDAVRLFVEDGDTTGLDTESQGYHGIRDVFTAPPIRAGLGKTSTNVIADGLHTKVSFMVKMTPSPDWFVGVSSLDLCDSGRWRKFLDVDLYAMDAGTDKGLTFSSPNWPAHPPTNPFRLSPTTPNHPASSFYYPEMEDLPRMGRVELIKVSEYKRKGKKVPTSVRTDNVVIYNEDGEVLNSKESGVLTAADRQLGHRLSNANDISSLDASMSEEIIKDVVIPCMVSEWGHWSSCSKTCGYGHQERHRRIIRRASDARQNCPVLRESRTCGSMRTCEYESFQFLKRNG